MAKLFDSGTNKKVTGKAADSNYTGSKTASSLPRVQTPARQTTTQNLGTTATPKQATGKAADSGYTVAKKQASQAANRQTVQNWWNNEQTKSAQDNSTDRAYTAKLTGGANIDNSTEVVKSLQRTFGGANDSAKTQYERTLKSKMGYGRNWSNPRSAAGNAIESGVAGAVADWLNALGTALKSDRRSGLAVDSGDVEAKATGKEWYNRAGDYLQKEADWARMLSENAYLRGSRNLNNAQKLLFDGAVAGTQMASDVALGTLTGGSATIPLAVRSFGSGTQQARQAGATENQQIAYGTAIALKEALTEKMFDGLAGIYGKGTADDFVDALARSFAKSDGGQALVRGLVNMGGEGAEEFAGGFVDPALQSIYNGKTLVENYRELNMSDLRHEGAVGMLLGGLGGSVNMAQTGGGQISSYADALRKILSEQNATALDTNTNSSDARYKELERKYLEGTLGKEEEDELWRLERMKGLVDKASESMRSDLYTKGDILKKGVPYQEWYDQKESLKTPLYHRRVTKDGRTIIDKPTYQKITKRITKKGAFITTADEKWLKRLEDQGATAVTIGDNIILRPDATVTEVLEEVYHFEQNKKKLNYQWEHSVMRTLNEIDAQKYLIAVADKYKIPLKEREETLALLKKYEEELEQHRKDGRYYD